MAPDPGVLAIVRVLVEDSSHSLKDKAPFFHIECVVYHPNTPNYTDLGINRQGPHSPTLQPSKPKLLLSDFTLSYFLW